MVDLRFYRLAPPVSLDEIAARFGIDIVPDAAADEQVKMAAPLKTSQAGDISFFLSRRYLADLEMAGATACFTTKPLADFVAAKKIVPLVSENPRADFARLTQDMILDGGENLPPPKIDPSAMVHPSAILGDGVEIGARTKIGAYCVIESGVHIGADCVINPLVHISFTIIGDRCSVKANSVIGGSGFGVAQDADNLFNIPHFGRVIIKNDVAIGSNTCVDKGQLGDTILSNFVKIDNQVQIGHNTYIGEGAVLSGQTGIAGSCHVGDYVLFGGRAGLGDHVTVGDRAQLAAATTAMSDVPENEIWAGSPAMPLQKHLRAVATFRRLLNK